MSKDEQNCPKEYSVSGIGQLQGARSGGKYLLVPPDRERACLGAPEEPPIDWPVKQGQEFDNRKAVIAAIPVPHPISNLQHTEGRLEGYVVHSRCWTLAEKHLGSQAIGRLDLVVLALREQWNRLIGCLQRQRGDFPDLFCALVHYQNWQRRWLQNCDPLHIPEIQKAFRSSVGSRTRQRKTETPNVVRCLFAKHGVPPEIIYLIAGYLEVTDARNMLVAFGEQLPVHYWRKRISDIFVEVDDADPGRIDWPYLAARLNRIDSFDPLEHERYDLTQLPERVWNRKRIINMLRPVKQQVLQEIHLQFEEP